jgi:hypothetical protein
MTNFQIDEMAIRFQQSEEALYNFFVNDYKSTIEDMPTNEQRDYWDKYHQLVGHLEFCRYMIERYYEEINSRLTYNRNLEQQNYIKALRKYIIDLGGDPTNCSYILSSEL